MEYDLKIVGGTIVDGTGAPGYRGDVGIRDGKVVALGEAPGEAAETIDAAGRVVAPGFVDIHTHYDAQVLWDRMLTISPWHGVTTAVIGNCGFGVAPTRPADRDKVMRTLEKVEGMAYEALDAGLGAEWPFTSFPEYLDALEGQGTAINLAALVGHTPIRLFVMGEDATEREATDGEVAQMADIVREAMAAGAIGFATSQAATHHGFGGKPVPSRLASFGEIDALVGAMAESGRGIMQATIGKTLFHDEFAALAGKYKVPVTWTALLAGLSGPGSHRRHLQKAAEQHAAGLNIMPQVACRPIMFDFDFDEPFPFEMRPLFAETMQTDREGRKRIYADPDFRANFRADTDPKAKNAVAGWAERAVVSVYPPDPSLQELPLTEVAAERGVHAVDLALDMSLETDFAARFRFPILNYDEDEVEELLTDPNTVVALSDAGAHASQLCDACYSTHLLGHWVREKGTMSVEQAVHALTQRPAQLMGITDRGVLAEGRPADVVVFDPQTVGAMPLERVHDQPAGQDRLIAEARGVDAVIVNGRLLRRDNADALAAGEALPGKVLRGGKAA
jgi:N-acyl-D-amino-acid deacylase